MWIADSCVCSVVRGPIGLVETDAMRRALETLEAQPDEYGFIVLVSRTARLPSIPLRKSMIALMRARMGKLRIGVNIVDFDGAFGRTTRTSIRGMSITLGLSARWRICASIEEGTRVAAERLSPVDAPALAQRLAGALEAGRTLGLSRV